MPQNTLQAQTKLLRQAIADLKINTPIRRVDDLAGGGLTIHLPYSVIKWRPPPPPPTPTTRDDDFTAIPYVGNEVATTLHTHGFHTYADLINTTDTALLDLPGVGPFLLSKIRLYLKEHYL